jgi:hypothetical protein
MDAELKERLIADVTDAVVEPIRANANAAIAKAQADTVEVQKAYDVVVKERDEAVATRDEVIDVLKARDELKVIAGALNRRLDAIDRRFITSKQMNGQTAHGDDDRPVTLDDVLVGIAKAR